MPSLRYTIRRALSLGPAETLRRGLAILTRKREAAAVRRVDRVHSTYSLELEPRAIARRFPPMGDVEPPEWLEPVVRRFLGHSFDLLGSGWRDVGYGVRAAGVEGHSYGPDTGSTSPDALARRQSRANRAESLSIRRLISPGYRPIDWHADFKSGYRWAESTWYRDIAYGHLRGVDVKGPWELARAQHLPLLAWACATTTNASLAEDCRRDFRDQVLDFVAANPPRFGPNWSCAMDVGIRAANWLVAYDVFRAAGAAFDDDFEAAFSRSIYEHGRHIFGNLEWEPDLRGNHYLADIVGLLFVAGYLPGDPEVDDWLEFAIAELIAEAERQFWPDGSNFEASTAYHRLSGEMLAYAVALLLGLPGEYEMPEAVMRRLERAAEFTFDIHRPDGRIVQFGDHDSGRFLKLGSVYTAAADGELFEDHLDLRHLVAAINGLFGREDFAVAAGPLARESVLVHGLAAGRTFPAQGGWSAGSVRVGSDSDWDDAIEKSTGRVTRSRVFSAGVGGDAEFRAYSDFGFYLVRTDRLWLAVRCGPIGQNGNGGHAHNDQLAAEVFIDGEPVWVDPGTYLYTPLPARRDEYRSVHAHHAPRVAGREPGYLDETLFRLGDEAQARCVYFGPRGFVGYHDGYGPRVWRRIEFGAEAVTVIDWVDGDALQLLDSDDTPPFSRGYGWVEREGAS